MHFLYHVIFILWNTHQTVDKREILSRQEFFSSNQLFYTHEIFAQNTWERIPVISTLCANNFSCKKRFTVKLISRNNSQVIRKFRKLTPHCTQSAVEIRGILPHRKMFRQINSLVTYFETLLLSQNFCQKCTRENSRDFHTVVHCGM